MKLPLRFLWTTLQLLGFGLLVGTVLGLLACYVLSNGRAALHFYLTFGIFGGVVGVFGSVVGGGIIGIMRLARASERRNNPQNRETKA
jgi:hypothetical protein